MLSRLRVLGPAFVAMVASVLVWIVVSTADPLDSLYPLNMATRASTYGYLFVGAAAGAFAAVEIWPHAATLLRVWLNAWSTPPDRYRRAASRP